MKRPVQGFFRTTLVGGLTFLLPVVLLVWLLQKAMEIFGKLAKPAMALMPDGLAGGVIFAAVFTAAALLITAFAAGLLARTELAQRFMAWVENSVIGSLPQFSFLRGVADSLEDSDRDNVEVVLVPADSGWALGFIFESGEAEVVPVFLPDAPKWTSGSVVFFERASIRPAGIGFLGATKILKKLGVGSDKVVAALARS
jgi:uncharacterized membrane protein